MHLWCLLLDYRCYTSQLFLGFLFAAPSPASGAYFSWGYPDQERSNFEPELEELIIDCREQPIRRPKKGPKKYDCGKKRRHRLKTEIRLTAKGQIKSVSKSAPGQNTILRFIRQKSCPQLDIELRRIVGIRAEVIDVHRLRFRAKKHRKDGWMRSQKNTIELYLHSVLGWNKIRQLKTFNILSYRDRNFRTGSGLKFNIIAGMVNLKAGF